MPDHANHGPDKVDAVPWRDKSMRPVLSIKCISQMEKELGSGSPFRVFKVQDVNAIPYELLITLRTQLGNSSSQRVSRRTPPRPGLHSFPISHLCHFSTLAIFGTY
jgi:hypothetical protein